MKKWIALIFLVILSFLGYFYFDFQFENGRRLVSPLGRVKKEPGPLKKYSFEALAKKEFTGSQIGLGDIIKEEEKFTSYFFSFETEGKKVTGQANLPKGSPPAGGFPVVVMLRGYADDEIYFTGLGTRKAAGVFAENGFITLAPDFLGFGGSDTSSADIIEARFERPITVLNLLVSIKTLEQANPEKVVLWGHSNGGQIAISVLEISKKPIPTTLWAPITKGFPESVLAYMGEMDDLGLKVKTAIDAFLEDYEPEKFSIDTYYADITAPLQVHQGTWDPLVDPEWSDEFVETMNSLGKEVIYFTYQGDDHNLAKNWDLVVSRDLAFFREKLK